MTRTDEQVLKAINTFMHYVDEEKFHNALLNYWLRYDLNEKQCELLNIAKNNYINRWGK